MEHESPQSEQETATAQNTNRAAKDDNRFRLAPFIEKLVLLVLGFGLTTVVGSYLSNQFRSESTRAELEISAMQSEISRAVQVFEAISQIREKRVFRVGRADDIFTGAAAEDREQRLADYRTAVIEWNDNLNRYRALSAIYFRPNESELACGKSFEGIALVFAEAHGELQKLIAEREDGSAEKLKRLMDHLNVCVYKLDSFMLLRINERRVDYASKIGN
jgi:hypothetical protein